MWSCHLINKSVYSSTLTRSIYWTCVTTQIHDYSYSSTLGFRRGCYFSLLPALRRAASSCRQSALHLQSHSTHPPPSKAPWLRWSSTLWPRSWWCMRKRRSRMAGRNCRSRQWWWRTGVGVRGGVTDDAAYLFALMAHYPPSARCLYLSTFRRCYTPPYPQIAFSIQLSFGLLMLLQLCWSSSSWPTANQAVIWSSITYSRTWSFSQRCNSS